MPGMGRTPQVGALLSWGGSEAKVSSPGLGSSRPGQSTFQADVQGGSLSTCI